MIEWIKNRWLEFRFGHSIYMSFLMGLSNFILLFFNFLIMQSALANTIFGNLMIFASVFMMLYIPVGTLTGRWHKKSQYKTDQKTLLESNPPLQKILDNQEKIRKDIKLLKNKIEGVKK